MSKEKALAIFKRNCVDVNFPPQKESDLYVIKRFNDEDLEIEPILAAALKELVETPNELQVFEINGVTYFCPNNDLYVDVDALGNLLVHKKFVNAFGLDVFMPNAKDFVPVLSETFKAYKRETYFTCKTDVYLYIPLRENEIMSENTLVYVGEASITHDGPSFQADLRGDTLLNENTIRALRDENAVETRLVVSPMDDQHQIIVLTPSNGKYTMHDDGMILMHRAYARYLGCNAEVLPSFEGEDGNYIGVKMFGNYIHVYGAEPDARGCMALATALMDIEKQRAEEARLQREAEAKAEQTKENPSLAAITKLDVDVPVTIDHESDIPGDGFDPVKALDEVMSQSWDKASSDDAATEHQAQEDEPKA